MGWHRILAKFHSLSVTPFCWQRIKVKEFLSEWVELSALSMVSSKAWQWTEVETEAETARK